MTSSDANLADSTADRKNLLLASTWAWTSVAIVFVAARFYCRIRLVRSVWWDDWMILGSVLSTIAFSVVWTIYANDGGCRHVASLTMTQIIDTARLNWISQPLCVSGLTTGKISVACLIYRLQSPTRWRTNVLIGMCSLMLAINITVVTLMFTQCTPVSLLWNPASDPNGHCLNPRVVSVMSQSASSYMAFVDLALAAIPVHMIWSLQVDRKKKIAICILLSTGWMAFGFAVVKIIQLGNDANREDITWATVWLFVWNAFEINIIIIAACIPTLVPLYEILSGRHAARLRNKPTYKPYSTFPSRLRQRFGSNKYMESHDTETGSGIDTLILDDRTKDGVTGHVFVTSAEDGHLTPSSGMERDGFNYGVANGGGNRQERNIAVTKQWAVTPGTYTK